MAADKIRMEGGRLVVPDEPVIPYIEGDGTGPDIWRAARLVFDAAVEFAYRGRRCIHWRQVWAGEVAYRRLGDWLPQDTIEIIKEHLVAIKGPLTTPVGGGFRSLNVTLRQTLDLYVCLRPVRWLRGVPSPLRYPEQVDIVIFRENTEDIYAGIEWMAGTPEVKKVIDFLVSEMGVKTIRFPHTASIGVKPVSEEGSKRLVRAAINYALRYGRRTVTLVHKGNIMKYTEGAFRNWGYEVAEKEFGERVFTWRQYEGTKEKEGQEAADRAFEEARQKGKVIVNDVIADNFLQQLILRPGQFEVVATMNLNGDYISDAAAALVGGIGIAPGANINYETGHAIFEATHGTAPKYAGQDKVNPSSVILSGALMLEYMGWEEAAQLIYKGLERTIEQKRVTYDFHRQMEGATLLRCSEFGMAIVENMRELASATAH